MGIYDIAIIGGGPAGLTAGIYAARASMKTVLLEKVGVGGLVITTEKVENYPGFANGVNGFDLMEQMQLQAERFGLEIIAEEAQALGNNNGVFTIKTTLREIQALSIVIATGTTYRKLDVAGEQALTSRGVSYCATCDGPLFRDKEIIVVGGGDAAVEEALFLAKFVKKIYLVHRRNQLRASAILQEHARTSGKIEFIWNSAVSGIKGKTKVEGATIKNLIDHSERTIDVAGVFIFIGFDPNTYFLGEFIKLDEGGYIITDSQMQTSRPGIYAAGDVRKGALRQIITACGDGAYAAVSAQHFVENLKGTTYK